MEHQFQFSPAAEKEFSRFAPTLQKRIMQKLITWEGAKSPLKFAKKLQGEKNYFRFRVGDYRIIVTPKPRENVVVILLILKIGHRSQVYS